VTIAEALTQKLPASSGDLLNADLPQPFAEIVQHCLAQKPEQRWTVKQISARLQGQTAPPSAILEEIPKPQEEKPRRTKQIAIAALVIVVVALAYMLIHRGSTSAPESASAPASSGAATQPAASSADSVAATGGTSGAVLNRVPPNVAASARRTIHGTIKVRVKVNVDASGNVAGAKFITSGPSQYFARISMEAARQWKFRPPISNGRAIPSEWTLVFEFTRNGTQEIPQQTSR
jgi:TonB family protein